MKKNLLSLEYFQRAAKNLLANKNCYGDRVAVVGQCKGADIALGLASVCPELVELTITQAGSIPAPIACDLSFGEGVFKKMELPASADSLPLVSHLFTFTDDGFISPTWGTFAVLHGPNDFVFKMDEDSDEWKMNYDEAKIIRENGFPLENIPKIFHFQV
jgi:hypothetical protein